MFEFWMLSVMLQGNSLVFVIPLDFCRKLFKNYSLPSSKETVRVAVGHSQDCKIIALGWFLYWLLSQHNLSFFCVCLLYIHIFRTGFFLYLWQNVCLLLVIIFKKSIQSKCHLGIHVKEHLTLTSPNRGYLNSASAHINISNPPTIVIWHMTKD